MDRAPDEELVSRYKSGDERAFNQLYIRHAPGLAARARPAVGPNEAESVAHDSLLKAVVRFDEPRGVPFRKFLWQVWNDERIDAIRRLTTKSAAFHQDAMRSNPDAISRIPSPHAGPEMEALSYDDLHPQVQAIGRKIDEFYPEDDRKRTIHHGVLQHLIWMEFPTGSFPADLWSDLALRLECPRYEISRAQARVRRFAADVRDEIGRND